MALISLNRHGARSPCDASAILSGSEPGVRARAARRVQRVPRTIRLSERGLGYQSRYNALLERNAYPHGDRDYNAGAEFDVDDQLDDRELRRIAPLLF